jgi:hypothetical protein
VALGLAVPLAAQTPQHAACAASLAVCPTRGCEPAGSAHALVNQRKRTVPGPGAAVSLSFDDFTTLQSEAAALVGEKRGLSRTARAKLQHLNTSSRPVTEGDLVEVTGFIVGTPHANKGESVNCGLPGVPNNDFHITLARRWDDTEYEGIVAEMIPQDRPVNWSTDNLRSVAHAHRQVLVRGQLFYDNAHAVNGDPDNDLPGQPKRFALWEVHPVAEFLVCRTEAGGCDASDPADWRELGVEPNPPR